MVPFVPNNSSNSTPTSVKKGQGTHPVDVFHKAWMKALKQGENARKTFDSDVFANSIRVHVKQLMQAPCKDLKQLKPTTCTCMKDITLTDEELEPVVQSIMPSVINQDLFSPNQDQIAFTISHVLNQD